MLFNIKVWPGGVGFYEQMHGDDGGTAALEFEWSAARDSSNEGAHPVNH